MRLTLHAIFGGLGAGLIVAAYALAVVGGISRGDLVLPYLTGGAIAAAGLACVWVPGRARLRSINLILSPTPSWPTYETYTAIVLFLALAAIARVAHPLIEFLTAASAALLMYCQSKLINVSKSRPAWRAREIPSLIVITALTGGTGMIALLSSIAPMILRGDRFSSVVGMTLAAMGAYRWRDYAASLGQDGFAADDMAKIGPVIYIGHGLTFIAYMGTLWPSPLSPWLLPVAGLLAITASAWWTSVLIGRLGHSREFTASPVVL